MLSGGSNISERRILDDDAGLGGRIQVNVVDSNARAANELKFFPSDDDFRGYRAGRAYDQSFIAADDFAKLRFAQACLGLRLESAVLEDADAVLIKRVRDENAGV